MDTSVMTAAELNAAERAEAERRRQEHSRPEGGAASPRFRLRAMSPAYYPDEQERERERSRAHNRDAALLLEDDLGLRSPDRAKKRPHPHEPPSPSSKKRRPEITAASYPHLHRSPPPVVVPTPSSTRARGKGSRGGRGSRGGKVPGTRPPPATDSANPDEPDTKPKIKRPRKSKNGVDTGLPESFYPSVVPSRLQVPDDSESAASSPAGTPFIPLDSPLPSLPVVGKVDHATLVKRAIQLEENQRKIWVSLARKDIPKAYKLQASSYQTKLLQNKKLSSLVASYAKKPFGRTIATTKLTQHDREEKDLRKKAEKAQVDRAKVEEEKREAQRQARKLEFLISQTELYSHFVGNKLKTRRRNGFTTSVSAPAEKSAAIRHIEEDGDQAPNALPAINFTDADERNLHRHAAQNAREAIDAAKQRAKEFDEARKREFEEARKNNERMDEDEDDDGNGESDPDAQPGKPLVDSDCSIHFPSRLSRRNPPNLGSLPRHRPCLDTSQLATRAYSIRPCTQDASLLGKSKTAQLRKFWNKKQICYDKDAPFHVLVTSYQLVVADEKYFQRVKWQYMVLDEAQAIKSSSSARWKTLLGFNCRNRLLLTGTPVQNSMQELWALLHFIMPSLFDSHDEFSEWFSKDIESAAENKGSQLNEHQLRRLHMILKPFMLRRIEQDIFCDLSPRQRALYRGLRANVSIAELLERANNLGDADSARSLMNLVMQFRKVCSIPSMALLTLFFSSSPPNSAGLFHFLWSFWNLAREGDLLYCPDSAVNPINFQLPRIFERDGGLVHLPGYGTRAGFENRWFGCDASLWTRDRLVGCGWLSLLGLGANDVWEYCALRRMEQLIWGAKRERDLEELGGFASDPEFSSYSVAPKYVIPRRNYQYLEIAEGYPKLADIRSELWSQSCMSRPLMFWRTEGAIATPIVPWMSDRMFVERSRRTLEAPRESLLLFGLPRSLKEAPSAVGIWNNQFSIVPSSGLLAASRAEQLPVTPMHIPEAKRLIYDSAKLARLDTLLTELKAGGHRVLIYFQMTRMIDLMEEYLVYRQYSYLRLDGGSKLEDRRDMVRDWQTNPNIFVFLLSTRAGGLGINLTAADTVVFYDHDWNPSNDAQAMDRAHRLGQTRQVTVYRLITKGTIDERIVQLARVKKDVQDIVVGNKQFTEATTSKEIVSLLLDDDQLANLATKGMPDTQAQVSGSSTLMASNRDLWADEGDEFFGSSTLAAPKENVDEPTPSATGMNTPNAMSEPVYGRGLKKDGTRKLKPGRKTGPGGSKAERRKKRGPITGDTLPDEL
ncbi:DNA-binding domain [Rhizoctonia solani]|uniref:Chromatin-remodeling ATPase INO80 n=1 Tax=Rhizoctonia solani TaxID=456999 RepID=A0A8H7IEQ3_9AGAM|nr:DNA-binding domain [Rhizoctonia solani]